MSRVCQALVVSATSYMLASWALMIGVGMAHSYGVLSGTTSYEQSYCLVVMLDLTIAGLTIFDDYLRSPS